MTAYSKLSHAHFRSVLIREKGDVYHALKTFFSQQESKVKPA
ncbi:hypothetical protein [Alicyclobacillus cycloheptanicus]|jgi:uncharacterized sporulation protein YeaH/YhbH (DUF444 family)|uniref:Uncharacterized sporulation protein YeaH/YhbH (DUF444 family) n=1 Tax=Alicyclobacillus cycloheptanicus TaxID=1457 RepID=A0ABT9XK85_9BACL|nr:hypothetical protein [Alicyclobacillus cycloheptanicus]MDQ0190719.1 uncharacterized sporulation protein YeaH/YhbH (DUF444 family) [Alicyclobacillus cycloheptanicus]